MSTSKKYSKEFKLETINLVLQQGYTINEVSTNLGVNDVRLLTAGSI